MTVNTNIPPSESSEPKEAMKKRIASLMHKKKKKSWYDHWAIAWGERSWKFKAVVLFCLLLILIIPAVVFSIWPLYFLGGFFTLGYMLCSKCLDNHYAILQENENLSPEDDITDMYHTILESMDKSTSRLQEEVKQTHEKNEALSAETKNLAGINFAIDMETRQLSHVVSEIAVGSASLGENSQNLKEMTEEHQRILDRYEQKMQELESKTEELATQTQTLKTLNSDHERENGRLKMLVTVLQTSFIKFSQTEKNQKGNNGKFVQDMQDVIDNAKTRFDEYLTRLEVNLDQFEAGVNMSCQLNSQHERLLKQANAQNISRPGFSMFSGNCRNENPPLNLQNGLSMGIA